MIRGRTKILVVDDDPDLLILLRATLEMAGFAAALATDGQSAVQQMREDPPALVLLDLMMPVADGWTVLDAAAAVEDSPRFIVVSAKTGEEDRARAFGLGVSEFITKPFDPMALLATVRSVLSWSPTEVARHRREALGALGERPAGA